MKAVCSGASFFAAIRLRPSCSQRSGGQRQADQPARLLGHEVDRLRRRELRRHHQVALVLAVFAVADDDHAAAADLLDRLLDRRERALAPSRSPLVLSSAVSVILAHARSFPANGDSSRSTYLATTSTLDVQLVARRRRRRGWSAPASRGSARPRPRSSPSVGDGEADAVERDRALVDDVAQQLGRELDPDAAGEAVLGRPRATSPTPSTWPWTMWPPSRSSARIASSRLTRAPASRRRARSRSSVWFIASVVEAAGVGLGRGQADAVDGDRVAEADLGAERVAMRRRAPSAPRLDGSRPCRCPAISPVNITTP